MCLAVMLYLFCVARIRIGPVWAGRLLVFKYFTRTGVAVVCVCLWRGLGYTDARHATTLQSCETGGQQAASDRQLLLSWLVGRRRRRSGKGERRSDRTETEESESLRDSRLGPKAGRALDDGDGDG